MYRLVLPSLLALFLLPPSAAAQVGSLDATFDGDGVRTDDFSHLDVAFDAVVDADGKLLVFGRSESASGSSTREARVAHYHADGSLDQSWVFNNGAFGCANVPDQFETGLVEPDGSIVAAGLTQTSCSSSGGAFLVVRYETPGGSASPFFSEIPDFHGGWDGVLSLVRQPDGKLVAAGHASGSTRDAALARYEADGSLDSTFGTDGQVLFDRAGGSDLLSNVQVQSDGKIVAAGRAETGGQIDVLLLRLNADGTFDSTFDGDGIVTLDVHGFDDFARELVLQADGKLVVAGQTTDIDGIPEMTVMRYDADGTLDASFGTGGIATVDFGELPAMARAGLALQADGKIVVAGFTETGAGGDAARDVAVARLDTDGTLDTSFDGDGKNTVDVAGGSQDTPVGMTLQPDGNIVVVGVTEYPDGSSDFALLRFVGDTGPLPVELAAIDAHVDGADVVLRWTTVSETTNAGFEVQRRRVGETGRRGDGAWEAIAFIDGAGTTTERRDYAYRVTALLPGLHRFRLKQVDFDGRFTYSPVVEGAVEVPGSHALSAPYPSPFNPEGHFTLALGQAQLVRVVVYDALGRRVALLHEGVLGAQKVHRFTFEAATLPSGLYLIRVEGEHFAATRRAVLLK